MAIRDSVGSAEPIEDQVREQPAAPRPAGRRLRLAELAGRVPPRWRTPLATYLACQVIFLLWWAAFWPGLMSYDSIIYVVHVTTGPWIANHSVLYDSLVWVSLHATNGLSGLTFGQTVAMSAALAYTVVAFRRLGVPGRWTAITAVIVALLPPIGSFIVFVWKDVPFVICAYLTVPTLAHLISLRGNPDWRRDPWVNRLVAALGLELLGIMLFRLNGFLVVAAAALALVILLPGVRGRLAAVATAAICLAFLLNSYVYPAVGIQTPPASLALAPAYGDIAVAYAQKPATFTAADTRLMARVAPLTQWSTTATCYDSDFTTQQKGFTTKANKVSGQLFSLWLRVLQRTPNLILGARICRGSIAWNIFAGPSAIGADTREPVDKVPANLFGLGSINDVRHNPYHEALRTRPLSSALNAAANFAWNLSQTPQLQWLLWRGAFWCYLSYIIVFAFARARRNWALLALAAIVIGQQLGILADIPAQLFRYMVSPIVIGIMLIPLYFARNRTVSAQALPARAGTDQAGPSEAGAGQTGAGQAGAGQATAMPATAQADQ